MSSPSRIIIECEDFGETYTELLPYLYDIDLDEFAKVLIDDINAIREIAFDLGYGKREDLSKMNRTITYVVRSSDEEFDIPALQILQKLIGELLRAILQVLTRYGVFADARFSVLSSDYIGLNNAIEDLQLILYMDYEGDYGASINKKIGQVAQDILNAYSLSSRRRRPRPRSRRDSRRE